MDRINSRTKSKHEHIAVDGKENRRSKSKVRGIGALPIVSAWSTENGIALGQLACEEKK